MRDAILHLYDRLIRAGIKPQAAARYCAELRDHRDDLMEHLEAQGMSPEHAREEAEKRLGSMEQLFLPMLCDRRNRSLAARWPLLCFAALPLVGQVLASALLVVLLGLSAGLVLSRAVLPDLAGVISIVWLILPVASGWLTLRAAARRACSPGWPLLGAGVGIVLATALQLDVAMPMPMAGASGTISVAFGMPALLPAIVLMGLVLLPSLLRGELEWAQ